VPGEFLNKSETGAWDFLEELAKKTLEWETTRDKSLGSRINHQRGDSCSGSHNLD